jgi:tetratricopeptide (TPR) repeat protein
MLVTLPLVMVLLDFWPLGRNQPVGRLLAEKWPFLLLTVASCAVTVLAQRAEAIAPLGKFSLAVRLENTATAYAGYLYKTVWPVNLAAFYPLLKPIPWVAVAVAVAVLLGISAVAWRLAKSRPYLAVGWLWYLGTLVPVIGLVQVGDQALADRYTYFPLIGIFAAFTWAAKDAAQYFRLAPRWPAAAAVAVAAGCLALTENQLRYWRDSETLFTHALAVTADNAPARLNLGAAYQEGNRPDDALTEYRAALRLDPGRHEIYNNIGRILNDEGRPAEALEYCRTAVALDLKSAQPHIGLGIVLAELGRFDEAIQEFSEAARLNASDSTPHFQTARVLLKQGRDAEAVRELRAAVRLAPDDLRLLIYTARVLATDENAPARDGAAALAMARTAAQLAGGPQPVVLDTLAMACAETGQFDEATEFAQQAVAGALAGGNPDDAAKMRQRLELYQKHQPARLSFQSE